MFKSLKRLKDLHYFSYPIEIIRFCQFSSDLVLAVITSTNYLENETVTQLIRGAITAIRNNDKISKISNRSYTAWKVFRVNLVCIFPHSDRIRRDTPYLSVFSPNVDQNNSEYGHFLQSVMLNENLIYDKPTKIIVFTSLQKLLVTTVEKKSVL